MGNNFSSIKVDKERRVWVRQRQQRPSDLRDTNPYPSYDTVYQEALPATSAGRGRRGRSISSEDLLPFYVPVAAPRHPTADFPGTHAQQPTSPQSMSPTHSIPMPYDTMLGQQAPVRQGPTQQEQMQPGPIQQGAIQSVPLQTGPTQQESMQSVPSQQEPVQPDPMQLGPMPPAPLQSGLMQPGPIPPGPIPTVQSGAMQSGPVPPGLTQSGPMQPMQPGPMQQGPFQQAFAPNMSQQPHN